MAPAGPKIPIAHSEVVDPSTLDEPALDHLTQRLHAVYTSYFRGLSCSQLRELIIERGEGTRLLLMYGRDGGLASFGSYRLEHLTLDGRRQLVYTAGIYSAQGYRGVGEAAIRHGVRTAARAKLAAPLSSLHAVLQMASGPAYRAVAAGVACVYPSPEVDLDDTPPEVTNLVRAVVEARGLDPVGASPFVVRNPFPVVQPKRERVAKLRGDPFIDLFTRLCTEPEHVLMTYFRLDPGNLLASAIRPLRGPYRRWCLRRSTTSTGRGEPTVSR